MMINYKNWLLTTYISSLLYIGSAFHYLSLLSDNFFLATISVIVAMLVLSLVLHFQNRKVLLITALVVTIFYIVINVTLLFN